MSTGSRVWSRFTENMLPCAAVLLAQSAVIASVVLTMRRRKGDSASRHLSGRMIRAIEDERKQTARELHDDIGQRLSLIAVQLGSLNRLQASGISDYDADQADILRELKSVISDVHDLSHSLHSSRLEHVGLEAALEELCLKISKHHEVQVSLRSDAVPNDLDPEVALCFYRVAQEALSNVAKHSKSLGAQVMVTGECNVLKMRVVDFGVGFEAASAPAGIGLATMEERLRAVGGAFSLNSRPGCGTTIGAEAPIRSASSGREELLAQQAG